jgi:hypothetical protein
LVLIRVVRRYDTEKTLAENAELLTVHTLYFPAPYVSPVQVSVDHPHVSCAGGATDIPVMLTGVCVSGGGGPASVMGVRHSTGYHRTTKLTQVCCRSHAAHTSVYLRARCTSPGAPRQLVLQSPSLRMSAITASGRDIGKKIVRRRRKNG